MPVPERAVDCGALYRAKRHELIDLVGSIDTVDLAAQVPATPAWSVHDALCHVVGITADLNAGNFGAGDPEAWTAHQVQARRNQTVAELHDEWEREGQQFEEGLRILGYEIGSHYLADLLQHTGDIRHALALRPPADDETLAVALDFYLISFEQALLGAQVGTVAVTVDAETWTLGNGPSIASVETGARYEMFRVLGGRRSESQIRALRWSGDVSAVLPVVSRYPLPSEPIYEST